MRIYFMGIGGTAMGNAALLARAAGHEVSGADTGVYPPSRHLIHHLFRGPNPDKLRFVAEAWARQVEARLGAAVEVRGPAASPIEKIKDEYRYQVCYFTDSVTQVVPVLAELRDVFAWPDGVTQVLDVDPMSLV